MSTNRRALRDDVGLLERSDQLSALAASLDAVTAEGTGAVVLVGGEAGVGKTALLRRFCDEQRARRRGSSGAPATRCSRRARSGRCSTSPRLTGGELEELVSSERPAARGHGGAHPRAGRRARDGPRARGPALGRRGDARRAAPAGAQGPGACPRSCSPATATTSSTARTRCGSSSASSATARAVDAARGPAALAGGRRRARRAARDRRATTCTARPTATRSSSPRCSRRARARSRTPCATRCSRGSRASPTRRGRLLEAVAIAPPQAELWLLEALAPAELDHLEECLASGMLGAQRRRRRVPPRARAARRRGGAPAASPGRAASRRAPRRSPAGRTRAADPARLAHHADAAGDADAVLRFAPAAAARAASLGAHREAAAQYARALRFADGPAAARSRPSCSSAAPTSAISPASSTAAIAAQERALAHRRALGDPLRGGRLACAALSRLYRFLGRTEEAAEVGHQAVASLERLPPGRELALAYGNLGHLYTVAEDAEEAVAWSAKALALGERARRSPGPRLRAHQHRHRSRSSPTPRRRRPSSSAEPRARPARRRSRSDAGRAYLNLVWWPLRRRRYALADRYLEAGPRVLRRARPRLWRLFLVACRARVELDRGRWDEAADSAGARPARSPHVARATRLRAHACSGWCGRGAATPTSGRCSTRRSRWPSRPASCSGSGRSRPRGPRRRGWRVATRRWQARPRPRSSSPCAGRRRGRSASSPAGAGGPASQR